MIIVSDNEILNNLLLDLKNYDIYNFLERVSSLNLIPQNQNKCMIFDTIIGIIYKYFLTLYLQIKTALMKYLFSNVEIWQLLF